MSTTDHVAAWIALLNAGGAHGYRAGDIAKMIPQPKFYTEVHVSGGPRANDRAGSQGAVEPFRLILKCVGDTEHNASNERDKAASAVNERSITVGTATATELRRETFDEPVAPDGPASDSTWSGASAWRYTL